MKKHLLAVAVAAAVTAPVMAQNVSVYGYLETGVENTKTSGTASTSNATNVTTGMFGSSRLGFMGSEDLGGGLKAGFRLEMSASAANGTGGSTDMSTAANGTLFNRGAEINLSGAFGTIQVGKLDHPGIEGNEVNTVGNIALFETESEGIGSVSASSDTNGTIIYTAPIAAIGGKLALGYTGKDDGSVNANGVHGGIRSYQLSGTISGITYKLGGGSIKVNGSTNSHKFVGGGVGYNFGPLNVGVQMQKQDVPASTSDINETVLTAKYDLGGGLDVRAAWSSYDVAQGTTSDQNKLTLAVAKALSKRTTAYVAYRSVDVNTTTNNDTREFGVYVSHSF